MARHHLLPAGEGRHRFHAPVPRRRHRRRAVVVGQRQQSEHAAADPPDGHRGGDVAVAARREQRHPRATRAAHDHRRRQVEPAEQPGEDVGLHLGLRLAAEAHLGLAAVGAVPDDDAVAVLGQGDRELADARIVLAEATAGRHDPGSSLTDDLVGDGHSVDFGPGHARTVTRVDRPVDRRCRLPSRA